MASIRDVARMAQVSPATVSRILNNNQTYKTTDETRRNVLRAVAELGYKPLVKKAVQVTPAASDRQFSVGCLLASTKGKYSDPFYLSILSSIEQELAKHNGAVTMVHTEEELENSAVLNRLLDARLDGLVMMRPLAEPLFDLLHSRIPHIVGIDTGHMPIDNVEYDHLRVSRMAVEYLYQKGHRRIGYIGGGVGSMPMSRCRRFRSYKETMTDLGLEIRPEWVLDCQWDDHLCMKLVEQTHKTVGLPTAFYGSSDLMAMAALRALYQLGIRVPEQVAVIGMSNIEMSQYAYPPLTTIDVPTEEMGITAARVMAERVHGDTTLPKRILLPSTLIERSSV
ncbi:MAG: LacI family DNA-binding transcriptional regulator [Clostridia bacterium]|nr:LacI family DNA-binding transcriptional regulator [Clostridia bacterium]